MVLRRGKTFFSRCRQPCRNGSSRTPVSGYARPGIPPDSREGQAGGHRLGRESKTIKRQSVATGSRGYHHPLSEGGFQNAFIFGHGANEQHSRPVSMPRRRLRRQQIACLPILLSSLLSFLPSYPSRHRGSPSVTFMRTNLRLFPSKSPPPKIFLSPAKHRSCTTSNTHFASPPCAST
jgi:hypothetical protein